VIAKINKQNWNTGILLLVSKRDRKARIELGAGWKREKDDLCAQIMGELIIPKFKDGEFSLGIVVGLEALDKMARDLKIPRQPWSMERYVVIIGVVALTAFTIVSLFKRGTSGLAWLFWRELFAAVGLILYVLREISVDDDGFLGGSSGGGGFSGGSFSGGSSGGGGATGSW
jgi:uncharacterized protein